MDLNSARTKAQESPIVKRTKREKKSKSTTGISKRGRKNDDMITFLNHFVGTKIRNGMYPPKKKENLMTTVCRLIKTEADQYRTLHISEE